MMHHRNRNDKIKDIPRMRQVQNIRHDSLVRPMLPRNFHQITRSIRGDDENVPVDGEVFAIAAADVETYGAGRT